MTLVLKNTFWQKTRVLAPALPRAYSDSCLSIRKETGLENEKLESSLSHESTAMESQDAATEFPLADDESSHLHERREVDFEQAANENVRLFRQSMSEPRHGTSNSGRSSSSSSSCGPCLVPNAAPMQQPVSSTLEKDPRKPTVKSEDEPSKRKRKRPAKGGVKQDLQNKHVEDTRTTVMMRNLPRVFSRDSVLKLLDDNGFARKYNFVYAPVDFIRRTGLGYAFLNFTTPEVVKEFAETFDGFTAWPVPCKKVCRVQWSTPHQGYEEHVQLYRNSPLMHEDVPDECRPVLLENGVRVNFPPPTKRLRAPRLRASKQEKPFWGKEQAQPSDGEPVPGKACNERGS